MLEARNVTYQAGSKKILDGVSVQVAPGETVGIVGPNGAGKSTLLRILCGFDIAPDHGAVFLDGAPLSSYGLRNLARRRAVLAQEQELRAEFPAFDVVLLGRNPHVSDGESPRDFGIAAEALRQVQADSLSQRVYTVLSGGEKQRVALARGAAQIWDEVPGGARYFLLDEPTNNLDLEHRHRMLERARGWSRSGIGVLVVLHDLNLAAQYSDRMVVLNEGMRVAGGTPNEVLTPELMRTVFRTEARIERHPCFDCPLVVSLRAFEQDTGVIQYEYDDIKRSGAAMGRSQARSASPARPRRG